MVAYRKHKFGCTLSIKAVKLNIIRKWSNFWIIYSIKKEIFINFNMKLFFRLDTPNNISNVATPGPCDGMVDITDLKSVAFGRGGSSPPTGTR